MAVGTLGGRIGSREQARSPRYEAVRPTLTATRLASVQHLLSSRCIERVIGDTSYGSGATPPPVQGLTAALNSRPGIDGWRMSCLIGRQL